jgi:hypothetical protein
VDDREPLPDQGRLQERAVAGHRADADLVALVGDVVELAEIVDVHEVLGRRQAQLHHRQQAVAAGDDSGVGTEALQQRQRVVDAGGPLVLERGRDLHDSPSLLSPCGATPLA